MKAEIAHARLAEVPNEVRDQMMRHRAVLPAGAIAVVARFFAKMAERGEHASAPSRESFCAACGSEATLGLLLRTLDQYAPSVGLAEGRALRRGYYAKRSCRGADPRSGSKGLGTLRTEPRTWPQEWMVLLPGLQAAPIRDSSINRQVASINRCASLMPEIPCPPRLGWLFAWELAKWLQTPDKLKGRKGVSARTAASYIGALVSLGLHGNLEADALDGMRSVQAYLQRQGRRVPKQKQSRIEMLYENGGYAEVLRGVVGQLEVADSLPEWSTAAAAARATAAILAVCTNEPARSGDVASWMLGAQLLRRPTGQWQLRWRQSKTGHWKDAGTLWPEIGAVVDEHILGGRPPRHAQRCYENLNGCNWLSLRPKPYANRWPSEKVKQVIGVPLHDLRTLAADYLRLYDPAVAPQIVAALLGHKTRAAGAAYSALCAETAAQREWQALRAVHGGAGT